jgi:hypothetical protein
VRLTQADPQNLRKLTLREAWIGLYGTQDLEADFF